MGKDIQVTPELLESAAGKIETLAGEYKTQYNQLYSETNAMASTWRGKDNVAFTEQIEGFKADFEKMHDLMLEYVAFLRNAAKSYQTTQGNVVNLARKLTN